MAILEVLEPRDPWVFQEAQGHLGYKVHQDSQVQLDPVETPVLRVYPELQE